MRMVTNRSLPCVPTIVVILPLLIPQPLQAVQPARSGDEITNLIQQLESGSTDQKLDAAARLASLGPYARRAVAALGKTLGSDEPALQYEALVALGSIGPLATDSVQQVSTVLSSDILPLRVAALDALRRIGMAPSSAITEQIEALTTHTNEAVMVAAVRCLVQLDGPGNTAAKASVPRLVAAFANRRPSVRSTAATALVELGDVSTGALRSPLSAKQSMVRLKACEVAGRLGSTARDLIPLLVDRLQDADQLVVRAAATAIGEIHEDSELVLPKLKPLLAHDSAAVRADVVLALMEFGALAKNSIPTICDMLKKDDSVVVRLATARALGQIGTGSEPAAQSLATAIEDPHGGVTVQAANSLSNIGPVSIPSLMRLLDKPKFRDLAVSILGEMGPEATAAVPGLLALLSTQDEELRREVFIALAGIGPGAKSAVPELLKLLREPTREISRAGAAYVLGNIGDPSCLPVLKQILSEPSPATDAAVLRASAWALVNLQPDNSENAAIALPHLIAALSSERPLVRKEALAAIGKVGSAAQPASEELIRLAKDDREPIVRSEAMHTLALLPDISDEALPVAIAAMDDDVPEVRNAARFLLGQMGPRASVAAAGLKNGTREGSQLNRIVSGWALLRVAPSAENTEIALPFILNALQYPNPQVRIEGARALGAMGIKTAAVTDALQTATADQVPAVASAAKKALEQLKP